MNDERRSEDIDFCFHLTPAPLSSPIINDFGKNTFTFAFQQQLIIDVFLTSENKFLVEHFSYRKLRAYDHAKKLVVIVYDILKQFPREENYVLCDQLRRAVISIPSNIAEGMGRNSIKEQIHFIEIAYGSLNEVMCQIELAHDLHFINAEQLLQIEEHYRNISQMLSGLRNKRLTLINNTR